MTRIQPECFVEVYKHSEKVTRYYEFWITPTTNPSLCSNYVTALFLIKPTSIPLAERLEARKLYQQNNVK